MKFSVLGSGSKGNALYIESGQTSILIDAGFSGKEIEKRLAVNNRNLAALDGLFLTHEHGDHIQGAGVISRRCRLPLYANEGTYKGSDKKLGKVHKRMEFETGRVVQLKDLKIRSFSISHDTFDPVGFLVSDSNVSIACCTDTGKVSKLVASRLRGCDALVLEFNHDPQMLKSGPYPLSLQQRVRSPHGHLANEEAASFLKTLLHDRLQTVVLAHLSETNNTAELALKSAMAVLGEDQSCLLHVAAQDVPSELFTIVVKEV
ncbi:metal-dependent hydrolase, beta-lactamase superfamily I [Desulfocapsa sulfexigens DSM 10523]|uniref:Metal-dependent hydrolase, beta-lactamase superfamily I n=1 Tax=Desulfocapsa sulfexigens (strain DSM 10523 / SB164P1) TaxID=1167006 RepID=M1NZC6_DESSD|nr:MBL fold metallo-hydrolase [Desulfocapsa sulfexigens]AGF76598.1 metal-dependent hydrolase, beta-lactamase superfamily I [Desulfocapsa sulfexigens DSM 10523]